MPKLLEAGKVYIAETPLFELETSQGSKFAYTVAEKDAMVKTLAAQGIRVNRINRSKGLGENTPEMMSLTTMSPATRKLTQLKFDPNDALVTDVTNMLFGSDPTASRKQFILDVFGQVALDVKEAIDAYEQSEEAEAETETVEVE